MNWLRCRISFSLLILPIMCIRESRSSYLKPALPLISEGSIDIASHEREILTV